MNITFVNGCIGLLLTNPQVVSGASGLDIKRNSGQSARQDDSLNSVWTAYARAQRQLQRELTDFFIKHRPDLKGSLELSRDLQLALIERRSLEFRYLLSQHAEQIVKDQGISRLVNFNWTEQNQDALLRANPKYEALRTRIANLRKQFETASQGPALREAQQALANDAELKQIYSGFEKREQAAQKLLEAAR